MLRLLLLLFTLCTAARARNVLDLLKKGGAGATHSQFAELLENTDGVHKYYLDGYLTVFAPSNAALNSFGGDKNIALILNHIASAFPHSDLQTVNSAISEDQLEERLTTLLHGHPPLWVRKAGGHLYVNQAKVNLVLSVTTDTGNKQYLYLIDSVLEPLIPKAENSVADYVDIKAGDILNYTSKFKIGDFSIEKYAEQIKSLGMEKFPEFSQYGKFTFFLPVDTAFQGMDKGLVDVEVVRSHIVPGNLLFTKPCGRQNGNIDHFHTAQYKQSSMELKSQAAIFEAEDGSIKAQSQTMVGNRNHARGKVVASVVKGNIPVQNGVVHLIDRPLIILASTLWEALDPEKPGNKRFSKFANIVKKNPILLEQIQNIQADDTDDTKNGATLFVPTNAAFDELTKAGLDMELEENADLIGFHFVDQIIDASDIRISQPQSSWGMFGTKVAYPEGTNKKIWLWNSDDGEVMVDGGGVGATIVDSNIRATNGIIHQIDKVLGLPLTSMLHKVKTDPMLKASYQLGEQEHFNEKLGMVEGNYTYLVPSDQAWEKIRKEYSTAYKVLFMGKFWYQVHHILEGHLLIGSKLSVEDILGDKETGSFNRLRGSPIEFYKTTIDGEEAVMVRDEDLVARVVRSNLATSNGYIHIIDSVLMKRRDVTLSAGSCSWTLSTMLAVGIAFVIAALVK